MKQLAENKSVAIHCLCSLFFSLESKIKHNLIYLFSIIFLFPFFGFPL